MELNDTVPIPIMSSVEIFELYYTPILVTLGTIGNTFSIYVFFKTNLRKLSSFYYLVSLAVSDNIFLALLFIVWLKMFGIDLFNKPIFCQLIVYLTSVSSFMSVWLVLAFTFERFIAVSYPLLRQSICTSSRAKLTVLLLTISGSIIYSPMTLFSKLELQNNHTVCLSDKDLSHVANIFNYIDAAITFLIPVICIIILNSCISRTILEVTSVRKILTQRHGSTMQSSFYGKNECKRRFGQSIPQNKVTKMLLIVSSVFLCFNFPSYVSRICVFLVELNLINIETLPNFIYIQHWSLQLFYTNFGINFVLYCISGQNFRKALRSLFCTRRLRRETTGLTYLTESRSSGSSAASKRRRTQSVYFETQELPQLKANKIDSK